jgi:hypothetical protein
MNLKIQFISLYNIFKETQFAVDSIICLNIHRHKESL